MKHLSNKYIPAKKIFKEKGTCSRTFAFILNREFGNVEDKQEGALDPLAGGIMRKGHQCGMLWGAALALGKEAYRKTKDIHKASKLTMQATQKMMESFEKKAQTVNCKEFTGCNMDSFFGLTKYMLKVTFQGMENSRCFNLAENWAPDAVHVAQESLEQPAETQQESVNCASEVIKRLGGSDEEIAMVTGFAGGMGLSGNGCGALAAAIWFNSLKWMNKNPGKSAYGNPAAKATLKQFNKVCNAEFKCAALCGKQFNSIEDHSSFLINEGCKTILKALC